ncbi:MAG: hypothetical protein IE931_14655 [Sphingobacteriales bacterium]|nr:hypothetical protein [Sphingobacteriales bacterium]
MKLELVDEEVFRYFEMYDEIITLKNKIEELEAQLDKLIKQNKNLSELNQVKKDT